MLMLYIVDVEIHISIDSVVLVFHGIILVLYMKGYYEWYKEISEIAFPHLNHKTKLDIGIGSIVLLQKISMEIIASNVSRMWVP